MGGIIIGRWRRIFEIAFAARQMCVPYDEILLKRVDVTDADFISYFSDIDPKLLMQIRQAIAEFFDVSIGKIHPTDTLRSAFRFDALEPTIHSYIVFHVLDARSLGMQSFTFNSSVLNGIGDLAKEVQRVFDGIDPGGTADG
jgi:hypothetical protein